jgi:acyl-CoA thioester hydrolase
VWFEIGRVELFRAMGFSYRDMEKEDDNHIVVAEAECSYKKPARYDDEVRIRTKILEARKRTIRFGYEVYCEARNELLATGETLHVICDKNGRPKSLAEKYVKLFATAQSEGHPKHT